jgi:hypothetical protein
MTVLKELHSALMLFRSLARSKRAQVAALARLWI